MGILDDLFQDGFPDAFFVTRMLRRELQEERQKMERERGVASPVRGPQWWIDWRGAGFYAAKKTAEGKIIFVGLHGKTPQELDVEASFLDLGIPRYFIESDIVNYPHYGYYIKYEISKNFSV